MAFSAISAMNSPQFVRIPISFPHSSLPSVRFSMPNLKRPKPLSIRSVSVPGTPYILIFPRLLISC